MRTLALIILFIAAIINIAWAIVEIGKYNARKARQEKDYLERYKLIQIMLKDETYPKRIVKDQIERLGNLPYKNPEKTRVLNDEINKRFENVKVK